MLILDEPVNGLDPRNISALRTLLQKLNEEQGITMLISSHILKELYLLATDYIIIHRGKILECLSHEQLAAKCENYVRISTDDLPECVTVLEKELHVLDYKVMDDRTVHVYAFTEEPQRISQALMSIILWWGSWRYRAGVWRTISLLLHQKYELQRGGEKE